MNPSANATLEDLVHDFDWASTDLGPPANWSTSLRMIVRVVLANRFPMLLWWGPDYIQIYNDAYAPILGSKHPTQALGRPFRECWHEVFDVLGPLVDVPFNGGPATWMDDIELIVRRHGFAEESHFMIAYSSVPDDEAPKGIGGVLGTVMEITQKVIGERRLQILSELGSHVVASKDAESTCRQAMSVLVDHPKDIPFALLYLFDEQGQTLRLASASGLPEATDMAALTRIDPATPQGALAARIAEFARSGSLEIRSLDELQDAVLPAVPSGPWPEPPQQIALVPLRSHLGNRRPAGVLVAGISACIRPDAQYMRFLDLVAGKIASAVADARAYTEERRRAEALEQIDRAKTAFFSNVSHEFRTPLTLMLGPLADALESEGLPERLHTQLDLVHRNAQRLLKLVNTLLNFARIEAGRVEASFAPVELDALTRDVASSFRSAMERAGLAFDVQAEPLGEPVYVDRGMWEQILLNLLSNAFKFTFEGRIRVALRREDRTAVLEVGDSGVGIPAHELPHLFERFHRVEGTPSRTHEGSGIGLALVQELVRLHGGSIEVDSTPGAGSSFRVRVPLGSAHLAPTQLQAQPAPDAAAPAPAAVSMTAQAFVGEVLRWLPGEEDRVQPGSLGHAANGDGDARFSATYGARILLADDNADMRAYLRDLLAAHYEVRTVGDGEAALTAARAERPDLIVADVMMPRLDGLGLVEQLRADATLHDLPVMLLSARAGQESRIEGLSAGADDYVYKPFHARELMARIGSLLELAHQRRVTQEELLRRGVALEAADRQKDEFLAMLAHELRNPLAPIRSATDLLQHPKLDPSRVGWAVGIIARQVTHLTRLVDDLLDISRITQGRIQLRLAPQQLGVLINNSLEGVAPLMREKRHSVTLQHGTEPLTVMGDPERLVQCLGNVLVNAAKYTPAGGEIQIRTQADGDHAVITVTDNGEGIASDVLPRVFDLFAQSERTLDRSQGGLGIGLAVVKRLVEMHGGTVQVRSDGIGCGASFEIRLARVAEVVAPAESLPAMPPPRRRILVVDDNRDGADVLAQVLKECGHEVVTAYSSGDALALQLEFQPEIALLDIGLPDINGYELAQRLRAGRAADELRLIAISGYAQDSDREQSRQAGFAAHLLKPVDFQVLQRLLSPPDSSASQPH